MMNNIETNFFTKTISLFTLLSIWLGIFAGLPVKAESIENNRIQTNQLNKNSGKTLLLFEQNKGQTETEVKYLAKANGYQLFLTQTETVFSLKNSDQIKMSFVGANKDAELQGENKLVTVSNYFSGQDQSKWIKGIPNFGEVSQKAIYQGIDAKYYGIENKQVEYDFIVSPNADANQIKLNFDGAKNINIDESGNLILKTENSELVQHKPVAYQIIDGEKNAVAVSYKLTENQVSFTLGEYDKSQILVIDPALSYLTYIGGTGADTVDDIAVDSQGNAYIVGGTDSLNFHGQTRASNDKTGIYVGKLDSTGQNFLYLTILESEDDDGVFFSAIALDAVGNAYIAGETYGRNYPTTANSFQPRKSICTPFVTCSFNTEAVVTKLDVNGAISYSTYLGGANSEFAGDIVVDSLGRAYVVGDTTSGVSFPKKNEFQGTGLAGGGDAYLTVFNSDGTDIIYSTGFGGNSREQGRGIALDSANNACITGNTESNGTFPVKNAFQTASGGGKDAFVAKFNPSLSGDASLIYSTFLGGSGTDFGNAIAVNSLGQAHITGQTGSVNFPLANAFRSTNQINEAFVTVLTANGGLLNSSFLGGADQEEGDDIKLGPNGLIYVAGNTTSNNFPLALPFQATRGGLKDAFVTKLRFGSGVLSSSFLGGNNDEVDNDIAIRGNNIFVTGTTISNNLATTAGVVKQSFGGGAKDGFVAKMVDSKIDSVGVFRPASTFILTQSTTNIVAQNATFTAGLAGAKGVSGDFDGDGIDTTGSFTNGVWKIRNKNFPTNLQNTIITLQFGGPGDLPVVGDWNGDGIDTIGVYRPSVQQFFLSNSFTNPQVDITIQFGLAEDLPLAGDWNGDGIDTIALFRPSSGQTFFTNQNILSPPIEFVANLGIAEDLPIAGDWNGDGKDSLGLRRPSTNEFFLSDDNINLRPIFLFGQIGDQPITGDWDGIPNP